MELSQLLNYEKSFFDNKSEFNDFLVRLNQSVEEVVNFIEETEKTGKEQSFYANGIEGVLYFGVATYTEYWVAKRYDMLNDKNLVDLENSKNPMYIHLTEFGIKYLIKCLLLDFSPILCYDSENEENPYLFQKYKPQRKLIY